ncbi:helix-turn-helix domain-containing protein [Actinocorallia sp. API 0066]|uniref:helix-turn-helix domain-containing protein n=1 Tax=Actinocorallia sp. API 0066 TaxID=2896846 RepID=UPI001E5E4173|nr:helix-turn-helix domain-containing protein [Actinocorallia sp. API 0066]MCD0449913.1 helix-turn-helix domain-containing protein [Actinocorallia sp. API 0066]
MEQRYYSVEEVAEVLGLHVKTVRAHIKDGRLRAAQLGRRYRVSAADLAAFTGTPTAPEPAPTPHVEVSATARIEGISPEEARRVTAALTASVSGRDLQGPPLRVQTAHDAGRAVLTVLILGGPADTAALLRFVEALAANPR